MDKLKVIENIKTLSKAKRIPMSTLEANAKVSVGYFARLASDIESARNSNEKERPLPGVEVMSQVANDLGVTIDDLLSIDYSSLEEPEMVLISFMSKLAMFTRKNVCIWREVPEDAFWKPYDSFELFPLSKQVRRPAFNDVTETQEVYDDIASWSLFLNKEVQYGGMFRLDYKGKTFLIAEALEEGVTDSNWHYRNFYLELYSLENNEISKVASIKESDKKENKTPIEAAFDNLYSAAMRSAKVNPTGDDIVKMLNDMMKSMDFDK